jgi:hypothetical protein
MEPELAELTSAAAHTFVEQLTTDAWRGVLAAGNRLDSARTWHRTTSDNLTPTGTAFYTAAIRPVPDYQVTGSSYTP